MSMMPAARRRAQFPVLEIAGVIMILLAVVGLVTQLSSFSAARADMPASLIMGDVPVSGLDRAQAQSYIEQTYAAPIIVWYKDQELRLDPAQVSFKVNSPAMLASADQQRIEGTFWSSFWNFLWMRPEEPITVELVADYSDEQLQAWVADVAVRYDRPPLEAQPVLETLSFANGQPGYTLNQQASIDLLRDALVRPTNREVHLVVEEETGERPGLETLKSLLVQYVAAKQFQGVVSVHVIDLATGDEMEMNIDNRSLTPVNTNCEIAYASTSTMKIQIMVDFFRYLDSIPEEDSDDYKNLLETLTLSGNVSANTMLYKIGGEDAQAGADDVTQMAQQLGLINTFFAAPYLNDPNEEIGEIAYYDTPARQAAREGTCINTRPDEAAQTTIKDLATMLDMIYQCAEFGGGGLIAVFPDEITQAECQMMLEFLKQNKEGPLIAGGLPVDTPVAHKHGWTFDTYGDAGIVFSPGGDYVITMFVWGDVDETQWIATLTFPIMAGISEVTFNYFNPELVNVPRRGQDDALNISPTETTPTPSAP
jgi:beta-lactamase class A